MPDAPRDAPSEPDLDACRRELSSKADGIGARLTEMRAEIGTLGNSLAAANDGGNFSGRSSAVATKGRPEPRIRSA